MADNDDWRRKRVEELGLADPTSWLGSAARTRPAGATAASSREPAVVSPPALSAAAATPPKAPAPTAPAKALSIAPPVELRTRRAPKYRAAPDTRLSLTRWLPLIVAIVLVAVAGLGWLLRDVVGAAVVAERATIRKAASKLAADHMPVRPGARVPLQDVVRAPVVTAVLIDLVPVTHAIVSRVEVGDQQLAQTQRALPPPAPAKAVARQAVPASAEIVAVRPATPVALPGRTFRPSFNCRRAKGRVNLMICGDAELARLDRQLSADYYAALGSADRLVAAELQIDQTRFLNERAQCVGAECVASLYSDRLDEIDRLVR